MNVIKFEQNQTIDSAIKKDEPLMAVISFDEQTAIVAHIDEAVEHHILLSKAGVDPNQIDKYFRIIFDREGCDWTFVCPSDYKKINDRTKRIGQFYKDGFSAISSFLAEFGYLIEIRIPHRYRRHFEVMK